MPLLLKIADAIGALTLWTGRFATAVLLLLIALVFYNVIGRYIVGGSPIWLQEMEWHLMAPAMLLGITLLMKEAGHVRVDMLYGRMPKRMQHFVDILSMIAGTVIAVLFVKYFYGFIESAWVVREGSADPGGMPGRYLLKASLAVCFVLLALQCCANALRHAHDFLAAR